MDINKNNFTEKDRQNGFHQPKLQVKVSGVETEMQLAENRRLEELSMRYNHRLAKHVIYKGMLLNLTFSPEGRDGLEDFRMHDGDVLVCGYPKSGTTWLQEVVYLIQHKADVISARSKPCYVRCPLLEDTRAKLHEKPGPRLMKTHIPFNLMPTSIHTRNVKMVYIVRNPKDVAVSYFHFYQSLTDLGNFEGSWEEFLGMFLEGYVLYTDWCSNVSSWWKQRTNPNVLIISYEDMKRDIEQQIWRIAEFLGCELSQQSVQTIIDNTTFNAMKDNPSTNFATLKKVFKLPFMRKGQVGDWKTFMTVAQNEVFDQVLAERISDNGLLRYLAFE